MDEVALDELRGGQPQLSRFVTTVFVRTIVHDDVTVAVVSQLCVIDGATAYWGSWRRGDLGS